VSPRARIALTDKSKLEQRSRRTPSEWPRIIDLPFKAT
jgi:hypothetical protein